MIQEIINFTKDILADYPELTKQKLLPDNGLYVFVDIDANGKWINENLQKGKDYDYCNKNMDEQPLLFRDCLRYQEATTYISMNKVKAFDSKQKIHSCSPFAVIFNFNFSVKDKEGLGLNTEKKPTPEIKANNERIIRTKRLEVVKSRLKDYKRNAMSIYKIKDAADNKSDLFSNADNESFKYMVQLNAFYDKLDEIFKKVEQLPEYGKLTDKDYLKVFLRSVPIDTQEELYDSYVKDNLLNGEEIGNKGVLGFLTAYSSKKPFIVHKTSSAIKGISYRFSVDDALVLFNFEKMWKRKCFPNPLPIVVDNKEINTQIIRIFNEKIEPVPYKELMKLLFEKTKQECLSNYYLLNYRNTKDGMVLDDLDFVPLFRFKFGSMLKISNVTESVDFLGNKKVEIKPDVKIENVFDFELFVVKEIFNNSLVKIKDGNYSTNYFGEIKPEFVSGGDIMYQLIMKYRKAFYDYIYKSQENALNINMFDDIMYQSIFSNIRKDEIKTDRFSSNNSIKTKINIWFSLYSLFINNKNNCIMASKVTELLTKMKSVTFGNANLETPEEFAFGAGQLVSYLIDRSAAANKTYALLEPYLQKSKSGQLQDAIAQTIAVYKHDIAVYKGNFENLSSQVLTDGSNVDMKPLLKFFLAGCFCPCVIYESRNENKKQS